MPNKGKPQTRSARGTRAGGVDAIEPLEDTLLFGWGDANAGARTGNPYRAPYGCMMMGTLLPSLRSWRATSSPESLGSMTSRRIRSGSVAREMVLTWVLTFPGCGLVGFVLARAFLQLF